MAQDSAVVGATGRAGWPPLAWPGLCGMAATLTGVGIGRFAYVAILPLLIQQQWFDRTAAGSLAAANLTGYFAGIGVAALLARRMGPGQMVRLAMLLVSLSFFACGWRGGGIAWFLGWRAAAGACGAILMVQAPVLILPATAVARRGRVGGIIFSGVGLGIVAAATVVPLLLAQGLAATWLTLGAICSLMTAASWRFWGSAAASPVPAAPRRWRDLKMPRLRLPLSIALLLLAYTLNAIGYLPHTLFWADFIHSELRRPLAQAGFFWACFGAGAACGPYLTGVVADRFGLGPTLLAGFTLKALGVALPLFASGDAALVASSVLVGFFSPGIVGAASSYALEIGGAGEHRRNWTVMNVGFSLAQAGGAALMVALMAGRASYCLLFVAASVALLASSVCVGLIILLRSKVECQPGIAMKAEYETGPLRPSRQGEARPDR
ncbi:MAG: YbfB/YjiJ family MFS transporter [Massilia sp.]